MDTLQGDLSQQLCREAMENSGEGAICGSQEEQRGESNKIWSLVHD